MEEPAGSKLLERHKPQKIQCFDTRKLKQDEPQGMETQTNQPTWGCENATYYKTKTNNETKILYKKKNILYSCIQNNTSSKSSEQKNKKKKLETK